MLLEMELELEKKEDPDLNTKLQQRGGGRIVVKNVWLAETL